MRQTGERQFYAVLIWEGSTNEGVLETLNKVVFGWHEIRRKRGGRTSTPSSSTCVGGRCHAEDGTLLLTSAGSAAALRVFWVGGGSSTSTLCPVRLRISCRIYFSAHATTRTKNGPFWFRRIREEQTLTRYNLWRLLESRSTHFQDFPFFTDISNHLLQFCSLLDLTNLTRWIGFHESLKYRRPGLLKVCRSGDHLPGWNLRNEISQTTIGTFLSRTIFGLHTWLICRAVSTTDRHSLNLK